MGIPLVDNNGKVLGNLAILDRRPIPNEPRAVAIFKIFANRASAELQRMKAERKLKKSEERYRRIIETTGEGFILLDTQFKIAEVNDALCRLVGYSHDDLIGRSPIDIAADDFRDYLVANWMQPLSYRLEDVEGRLAPRKGPTIPVRIYGDILKDDRGDTIGYMYFIIDITHQKRSLALAGEVQKTLLPQKSPRIKGFDIAGRTLSCQEIGGDYFDYLSDDTCPNPHLDVIVGDVTGHGVEAALLMTTARAHLRMQALRSACESLSDSLAELNRHLVLDVLDTGRFMTLFYLRLNTAAPGVAWARAGHPPAVVYSPAADRFTELSGRGIALGLDPDYVFEENAARDLADGTVIAIGTDGIWESVNQGRTFYGKERFYQAIRENADHTAQDILNAVFDDLKRFSLGVAQEDDITLVILKTVGKQPPESDFQI
jgi:sigma-B regulation protein RsbU (phosphoserine phosphatase)